MSAISFLRLWCGRCYQETTHRRHARAEESSAKVECTEHATPPRVIDWVQVAVDASSSH